ncbi:MAG TPA: hypothetical protein VN729_04430 [Ktedonobacteraceae bacterium]|nr:hypothetical protein [Ktedonobacteraceae bacterium]
MNAIGDMVNYYERDDDNLRDELLCFLALLNRAKPLPEAEMETVLRRIRMHDPLLEADPWVQEYAGRQKAEGEVRGIRLSIETIVQTRFPSLFDLAMERLEQMHNPLTLQRVLIAMSAAQNERKARHYLMALQDSK